MSEEEKRKFNAYIGEEGLIWREHLGQGSASSWTVDPVTGKPKRVEAAFIQQEVSVTQEEADELTALVIDEIDPDKDGSAS